MQRLKSICLGLALGGGLAHLGQAQSYMPFEFDGLKVQARPVEFKDTHIRIYIKDAGLTNVPWGHLTQGTLQALVRLRGNPAYAPYAAYAAPFLDPAPQPPPQGPRINVREVRRMDRPVSGGLLASQVMFLIFFLLYAANVYAGYEVAVYKHRNTAVVCSLSALAPVIVPVIYLAMPDAITVAEEEEAAVEETAGEGEAAEGASEEQEAAPVEEAVAAAAPEQVAETVFRRGQFTFNRRFFETKLAGFLKIVPGEAEKDMVIVISSSRGTYIGQRLTRIAPNDLTLYVVKAGVSQDVLIRYDEISEIKIRRKDAA